MSGTIGTTVLTAGFFAERILVSAVLFNVIAIFDAPKKQKKARMAVGPVTSTGRNIHSIAGLVVVLRTTFDRCALKLRPAIGPVNNLFTPSS